MKKQILLIISMIFLSATVIAQEGEIPVGITSSSNPHYLEPLESNYLGECYTSLAKKGEYIRLTNPKNGISVLFIVRGSTRSGDFAKVTIMHNYFSLLKDKNNSTFKEILYYGIVNKSEALAEIKRLKESDRERKIKAEEFEIKLAENKRVKDSISKRLETKAINTQITYYSINDYYKGALANLSPDSTDTGYSEFGGYSAASANIPVGTFLRITSMAGTRYEKVIYVEVIKDVLIQDNLVDLIVFSEAYKALDISISKKQSSVVYEIISKDKYLTQSNQN